jgi:hypothetical protein
MDPKDLKQVLKANIIALCEHLGENNGVWRMHKGKWRVNQAGLSERISKQGKRGENLNQSEISRLLTGDRFATLNTLEALAAGLSVPGAEIEAWMMLVWNLDPLDRPILTNRAALARTFGVELGGGYGKQKTKADSQLFSDPVHRDSAGVRTATKARVVKAKRKRAR